MEFERLRNLPDAELASEIINTNVVRSLCRYDRGCLLTELTKRHNTKGNPETEEAIDIVNSELGRWKDMVFMDHPGFEKEGESASRT